MELLGRVHHDRLAKGLINMHPGPFYFLPLHYVKLIVWRKLPFLKSVSPGPFCTAGYFILNIL